MSTRYKMYAAAFLVMVALPTETTRAQGILRGVVVDSVSREPLIGVNVLVLGTSLGASTDVNGDYRIAGISPGANRIRVSYVGYHPRFLDFAMATETDMKLDIALSADVIQAEEVIVTAQLKGQLGAINSQISSNRIVNVVSKDKIRELPDANAAESIGRLPGVAIQRDAGEGTKVIVRGMEPKFNSITINNQKIPSTDQQNRSVDLSMISSDILSGMEVVKAITPDQDGDAVGGTVNFQIKKADEGLQTDVKVQGGYNQLNEDLRNARGSITVSDRFLKNDLGVILSGNWQRANRGSDNLNASYSNVGTLADGSPNIRLNSLGLTDRKEIRFRYGANLVLDYALTNGELMWNSLYSRTDRDEISRRKRYSFGQTSFVRYLLVNNDVNVDLFTNSLSGKHDLEWMKLTWQLTSLASRQNTPFSHESEFRENSAFINESLIQTIDDAIAQAKNDTSNTVFYTDRVGSEQSSDRDLTAQVDMKIPFNFANELSGEVKVGGKFRRKTKSLEAEFVYIEGTDYKPIMVADAGATLMPGSTLQFFPNISNFYDRGFSYGEFLRGRYNLGPAIPLSVEKVDAFMNTYRSQYKPDYERDQRDFEASEDVLAGYMMSEINVGPVLMFLPGFRYEQTSAHYKAKHSGATITNENGDDIALPGRDTIGTRVEDNFLPMFHVRYRMTEWLDFRLAYTHALARPDYIDLTPWQRETSDGLEQGDPYLHNTKVKNYDLFVSTYGMYGLFTVGAFYKELDGIVYTRKSRAMSIRGAGPVDFRFPENSRNLATVKGMELDLQTNFRMLPAPFDGIILNLNYSIMDSRTQFPYQVKRDSLIRSVPIKIYRTVYVDSARTSRMPGQANQIANATIGFERGPFSARISATYQGDVLREVGDGPELDGFTKEFLRWDMTVQYKIWSNVGITFDLNNLSSLQEGSYLGFNSSATREEYYGWTADLGLKIEW